MPTGKKRVGRSGRDRRLFVLRLLVAAAFLAVAGRLFVLQVLSHEFYSSLASDQHSLFERLFPERGTIYLRDPEAPGGTFPVAVNKTLSLIYANPCEIKDPEGSARLLAPVIGLEEGALAAKLSLEPDPYEPLRRRVDDDTWEKVKALGLTGIYRAPEKYRFYPEHASVSHLIGFVGSNEKGENIGRYGVEGYWNEDLAGKTGFLETERDPVGRWIGAAERRMRAAEDGVELVLTVDRNVQHVVCEKLAAAVARHGAVGGAVVVLDPRTGAVIAACGIPDFDPNSFSDVQDVSVYNNPVTFYAYEPGSVFKPVTMAAAIDAGKLLPSTTYEDRGSVVIGPYTIRNSDGKANGIQTMTQVLEKSLNTGAIYASERLGDKAFLEYVQAFGFGQPTGIELDSESPGNISSLFKKGEIWSATASFGQGITATPLQLAAAYAALANGGKLMKPYLVEEVRRSDGSVERAEPTVIRQVITKRAATLVGGMLVRVVENGHGKRAGVPGYWVAGKTGTAQISRGSGQGYEQDAYVGSFIGFAPVDDPAFVMAVKIDRPQDVAFAESTAAPLFGEIARFLLQYMKIPPDRPIN